LLWLEGGISHLDSWDVKANSGFKPISTKVSGVQISEIFPGVAKHMDKLSIIRSMKTQERNHPQGTIETLTGHRPNPALKFPSFGSIVSKERLQQAVANPDQDITPNAVEVHVSRLRAKLGTAAIVRTLRGLGYRLEEAKSA